MAVLEAKFNTYYTSFETNMTKAGSAYADALASIEQQFTDYGIPIEERAKYIVEAQLTALQTITASAVQATLGIIAEEKKQDAIDSQILNDTSQRAVDTSKIALDSKQGLMIDKQTLKIVEDILLVTEQTTTQKQVTVKTTNEALKIVEDTLLVTEQINTQTQVTAKTLNEALKVIQETLKVIRDKQGYDDQMIMKTTEQQANLASFAVNANSTTAQAAIDNLKCLMLKQLSRTVPLVGETTCTLTA